MNLFFKKLLSLSFSYGFFLFGSSFSTFASTVSKETVQEFELIPSNHFEVQKHADKALLTLSGQKIAELQLYTSGPGRMLGLKFQNALIDFGCAPEFIHVDSQFNSFKCQVTQYKRGIFRLNSANKKYLYEALEPHSTYCVGFLSNGQSMNCQTFAEQYKLRATLVEYQLAYQSASERGDYRNFIQTYKNNDLTGLVEKARQIQHKKSQEVESKNAKIRDSARNKTAQFRKSLAVGDQSNCGLVIDVKKPIVQVQSKEGLLWVKIDEIYPNGLADCQIVEGNYIHQPIF